MPFQKGHPFFGDLEQVKRVGFKKGYTPWNKGLKKKNSQNPYPPEFTTYLKRKIKRFDGYKCQLCSETNRNKLVIHHINYNKNNCQESNLITLCRGCNSRVNANRRENSIYIGLTLFFNEIRKRNLESLSEGLVCRKRVHNYIFSNKTSKDKHSVKHILLENEMPILDVYGQPKRDKGKF